ncbi:hypothetical protein Unana1_02518 [Umbelopsis nana]
MEVQKLHDKPLPDLWMGHAHDWDMVDEALVVLSVLHGMGDKGDHPFEWFLDLINSNMWNGILNAGHVDTFIEEFGHPNSWVLRDLEPIHKVCGVDVQKEWKFAVARLSRPASSKTIPELENYAVDTVPEPAASVTHSVIDLGTNTLILLEPGTKYVAISHVWLQGQFVAGHPSSAYSKLRLWAKRQGHSKMWIDTACISSIGSVRDQQVLEMDEIYRNAQAVVICDSELASKEGNVLDLLSRAAWNSRVWTLQEAILNPTRFVLTSTGVTQLPKIVVTGQFADVRYASRLWWMHSGRTDYTAQEVYSLLEGRSATVEDDLWIGVAGIVPEVRKSLLNRTSSVAQAVSQLLYVDDSMLISNDPRYTQIGLSWMPKPGSSTYRDYTEIYTVNNGHSRLKIQYLRATE